MKTTFTGPAWFLFIFGFLLTVASALTMRRYLFYTHFSENPVSTILIILRIFAFPLLYLAEARLYWWLRRYNTFYGASWAHCFGVLIAFFIPVFFYASAILHYRLSAARSLGSSVNPYQYLFWIVSATAHTFFIWVIIQSLSIRRLRKTEPSNPENLLDDVLP